MNKELVVSEYRTMISLLQTESEQLNDKLNRYTLYVEDIKKEIKTTEIKIKTLTKELEETENEKIL